MSDGVTSPGDGARAAGTRGEERALNIGVFASGGGTNLQALLDRLDPALARVALVLSDRPDARALERGRAAGARTVVVTVQDRPAEQVADEMIDALRANGVRLIVLAGFIRKVPEDVVRRWSGRILNIHPALLPAFGGKGMYGQRVHAAVLAAGAKVTGVTVHLVDEEYDRGRIVAQWPVPVHAQDTPETLAARVLRVEHVLYPAVVEAAARALLKGEDLGAIPWWGPGSWGAGGEEVDEKGMRAALGLGG